VSRQVARKVCYSRGEATYGLALLEDTEVVKFGEKSRVSGSEALVSVSKQDSPGCQLSKA
jgi:hypothetical protein